MSSSSAQPDGTPVTLNHLPQIDQIAEFFAYIGYGPQFFQIRARVAHLSARFNSSPHNIQAKLSRSQTHGHIRLENPTDIPCKSSPCTQITRQHNSSPRTQATKPHNSIKLRLQKPATLPQNPLTPPTEPFELPPRLFTLPKQLTILRPSPPIFIQHLAPSVPHPANPAVNRPSSIPTNVKLAVSRKSDGTNCQRARPEPPRTGRVKIYQ